MTNKERHIAVLNRMLESMDVYDSIQPTTERKKAIKAAIKALEQQPCEDCISRQAAKRALEDRFMELQKRHDDKRYETNYCLNTILELPSVTPQQKYGKWILADEQNKEDVENDNYRFICSECQCSDIHAKGTIVPYCWKCGAKMQESEDKE